MRFSFFAAAMVILLPISATAGDGISTFTLDNGMQGVVVQDHRAPVVTHMVWYRVGAADEQRGKSGLAHLLEHLMFKGTKKFGPGEFSRIVAANGGSENAFTSSDYTGYWQRVASDRLELMMEMESDRMRNLILSDTDVVTERSVILEERNTRTDSNPGALFREQRMAALYLNHPYGIPIIGWRHEVKKLTREDALAFYHKYYAPNNAILVVAGDVDPVRVKQLANRYYGKLAPTPGLGHRVRPHEPPQLAARRLEFADPRVSQPYVIRTYLAPERNPGDQREAAALSLLAEVLGGSGLTSVLGQKLEVKQDLALSVSAFYDGVSLDETSFALVIVPKEGVSLRAAEDALDKALSEFMRAGVDGDQLARIKAQVQASQVFALDAGQARARRLGQGLTSGLRVEDIQAWPDLLQSIQPQESMDAAKMVFNRQQSVTGWLERSSTESSQ